MAQKLSEVVGELEGSDFEDSDDEFDGYLDMEDVEEADARDTRCDGQTDSVEENIGANVEVGGSSSDEESSECDEVPVYSLEAGCSASVVGENPIDFFSLLIDDTMLQTIVTQTNLYAQQFIESHELAPHSRVRYWSKAVHDMNELRRFLAMIIVMGLVRYPQIEHHWSTQWPYSTPHFSSVSYL